MSTLPDEVLLLIIHHLNRNELLQCQLTCKQWHKVSLVLLYKCLAIKSEKKAILYARTISESPELGKYLKSIYFYNVFLQNSKGFSFDNHGAIESIMQHCPNIIEIRNEGNNGSQFWTQLMHAATQGQLPKLTSLPQPSSLDLRWYIYTALLFKNSLNQIWLFDDFFNFGPQLAQLGAYQTLCDQIDQFKNLQFLTLSFTSEKQLSYFDGLIDKCHHLKELVFNLTIEEILPPAELEPVIRPRPDIHTFQCNWKLIDGVNQLEYVMRKFPNLKSLIVILESDLDDDTLNCSGHTLIKFIQYTLSIPYFKIEIDISNEDLLNIWTELMKKKVGPKDLTIGYQSIKSWSTIDLSSESEPKIFFPSETDVNGEPSHIWFFSKVGGTIRSLIANISEGIPSINDRSTTTIEWLFDILQRCPLMEEIKILNPSHLSPSLHALKYPSVKKLVIKLLQYSSPINFLDCLSFSLPNLHQLSFNVNYIKQHYTEPIAIDMPHTNLDLLTWNETVYNLGLFRGAEVYIKLKTDAGTKFYVGNRNTLFQINSKRYDLCVKYTRFDIKCKKLKELRIKRITAPEFNARLIF